MFAPVKYDIRTPKPKKLVMSDCVVCGKQINRYFKRSKRICIDCTDIVRNSMKAAHNLLNLRIMRGEIEPAAKLKCTDCGKQAVFYDFRNYLKQETASPVCKSCNGKRGTARFK